MGGQLRGGARVHDPGGVCLALPPSDGLCVGLQFGSSPVMVEEAWEGSYAEEPESMTPEEADQLLSTR